MLPAEILRCMRIVIQKKSFSPALTTMGYKAKLNTFVGTDSFVLFEYKPKSKIPIDEDFTLKYEYVLALEKLADGDAISYRGTTDLNGEKLIQVVGACGKFFVPLTNQN